MPWRSHQTLTPPHSFLSPTAQALVLAISSHPLPTLAAFLASRRDELLRADITSLLKALELSGHWEWALALLRWAGKEGATDASALELVVRALGREGQHCVLLDEMPLPPSSRLDVSAYTTVLHALELFAELQLLGYEIKRDKSKTTYHLYLCLTTGMLCLYFPCMNRSFTVGEFLG
jgi:pentatricopeptide repeat domain-containing protein 1